MTIDTVDGAGTFTLTSSNQQATDYMNVIRSTVDASPKWYAGANSTDGTGNTNWLFSASFYGVTGKSIGELEYSSYAIKTGLSGISLNMQKLSFYNSQLGTNYYNVHEAEIAFLKSKTGLNINNIDHLWRSYMVSRGVTHTNSINQMKVSFFIGYGFE